jgi:predicted metalloprotease
LKNFIEPAGQNRGHDERKTYDMRSREICPGGVGFETRSASGGCGAVLVANLTRPGIDGVSVLVIGNWLGLHSSKPDDKHVNANGEAKRKKAEFAYDCQNEVVPLFVPLLRFSRTAYTEARKVMFNQ